MNLMRFMENVIKREMCIKSSSSQARTSPRLRQHYDLRNSAEEMPELLR